MVQLQIKFITNQEKYKCSESTYTLSGSSKENDLNKLLKKILSTEKKLEEDSKIAFDFLINNELLRLSLVEHLNENNLSNENVLEVEYFVKQSAPEMKKSFQAKDWVNSVKFSKDGKYLLIGADLAGISIWSVEKQDFIYPDEMHHPDPGWCNNNVQDVEWLAVKDDKFNFASSSLDQLILLYEAEMDGSKCKPVISCVGHIEAITTLRYNPHNNLLASGSDDKTVKIWNANVQLTTDEASEPSRKRRRPDNPGFSRTPEITLADHKDHVNGVDWINDNELVSCSADHTVKIYDLERQQIKLDLKASLGFNDLDYSQPNNIIAAGCMDRHIRLFDPRTTGAKLVKTTLTSHHNWVKSLKWSPVNQYQLVSGGYDNRVKTWDIRSHKTALYDIENHTLKVHSVDWSSQDQIASGGEDKNVFLYDSGNVVAKVL